MTSLQTRVESFLSVCQSVRQPDIQGCQLSVAASRSVCVCVRAWVWVWVCSRGLAREWRVDVGPLMDSSACLNPGAPCLLNPWFPDS